jgi:hypothetical protein
MSDAWIEREEESDPDYWTQPPIATDTDEGEFFRDWEKVTDKFFPPGRRSK